MMTATPVLNEISLKRNPLESAGKSYRLYQGSPHPFGSTVQSEGVNFKEISFRTGVAVIINDFELLEINSLALKLIHSF
jgi:hypothetical protein